MMQLQRRWLLNTPLLAVALMMGGCFKDPPAADPETCDAVGIKDLVIGPPTPIVGTEFELQWTRVGVVQNIEHGPGIGWIQGNSSVIARLETPGGLTAEVTEPFDYSDFGNGEGEFEQPDSLSVAELIPTFADLAPGDYTASLEVVGNNFPACPPQGTSAEQSVNFTIAAGSSCVAPDVTFLDLEIRDLSVVAGTTSIEWSVDYNVESAPGADPGMDVTLDHEVTVTNADTGEVLGSTTVSSAGPILPGDSVTETLQLMTILSQPPQSSVTIRVEVTPGQNDAECGGSGEDFTENNAIEITTQL